MATPSSSAAAVGLLLLLAVAAAPSNVASAFAPSPVQKSSSGNAPASASPSPLFRRGVGFKGVGFKGVVGSKKKVESGVRVGASTLTPDDTSPDAPAAEDVDDSADRKPAAPEFDWYKSWYPLVPVEYLDAEKPHSYKLLGIDLVVWNDGRAGEGTFAPKSKREKKKSSRGANGSEGSGTWRVFADECPHRKVPLSEGRVEDDGTLLCSYHAWRFDGDGDVASVPQADESELAKVKANPKSSCNAYPAKVVNGLLWVWPVAGSDAVLESELTEVPVMKLPFETDDDIEEERVFLAPWNFRQLPYGHDYFIENVVDPAHVPSSHHNVVGDRYTGPKPMKMTMDKPLTKSGFSIQVEQEELEGAPSTTEFVAPSLVQITQPVGTDGARTILELYSSPSTPGFCNHIGRQVIVKTKSGEVPSMLKQFLLPMPLWLLHLLSNTFLNQDALFLHAQERKLHERGEYSTAISSGSDGDGNGGFNYNKAVLPISADRGVINFRNWMRSKAGGRIPYRGDPAMPPVSNEVVFDTYNSHTKDCKYCTDALRRLRKVRYAAYISAAVLAAVRPRVLGVVGSTVLAAACGGVGIGANKLMKMMHRMDYSHSEND